MNRVVLSFSGAGHLLPYHLGVARHVLQVNESGVGRADDQGLSVEAVMGSSSGALAAIAMSLLRSPDRIEEYAKRFIHTKGRGMGLLEELLREEHDGNFMTASLRNDNMKMYIAVTRCLDGKAVLMQVNDAMSIDDIMIRVQASCTIPQQTFHPNDLWSSEPLSYPDHEGVYIDDEAYVDGGIAAPAPILHEYRDQTVVVSPIIGSRKHEMNRISPVNSEPIWWPSITLTLRSNFQASASWSNLKALRAASGSCTSQELDEWYKHGQADAERFFRNNS